MSDDHQNADLDAQLLAQMREDFLEESQEYLDQLNLNLTRLEEMPRDEELINEIFRAAHTLKGSASFVGLDGIRAVAHKMEDVFGAIRRGTLQVSAAGIDVMFEGLELLTLLRDKAVAGDDAEVDISGMVEKLEQIFDQRTEDGSRKPEDGSRKSEIGGRKSEVGNQGVKSEIRNQVIRVPTKRLDTLVNLAGELITSRNRLNGYSARFKDDELESIASAIDRLTSQLHANVMSVRMVPIERLFIKFPGVVRNLAREKEKEVTFVVEGKETELDKNVIEQIYDPIVHLLRNAIDHGIETPEVRQQKGKPRAGRIRLSARHHENSVIIETSDDGNGIDPEKIKTAAVQKGIITAEEASVMTDGQAIRLIFAPGFSTAGKVTDVSGRGVGMDVVKENVQKLRGRVDIITHLDKGTTFRIQMPLTLAILEVLLVKVGGLTYALPIHTVNETLLISASQIRSMEKREVVFIRDVAHPFKRLSTILNAECEKRNNGNSEPSAIPPADKPGIESINNQQSPINNPFLSIVVVGLAEKRVALHVDELLGKQEVVMKTLGGYLGKEDGIEGASILADGSVTLIVDVGKTL